MSVDINDQFGTLQVTNGDTSKLSSYYATLETLAPLFTEPGWQKSISGWYVNVTGAFNLVRVSYFASIGNDPRGIVRDFLSTHGLAYAVEPGDPHPIKIAAKYGGEEQRYRNYLATYSPIGLDVMRADLHHAQCLCATFRWQVFMSRRDYKAHFESTFDRYSPAFNAMSESERRQFWLDLAYWPNPPQVDWAHMFVNMVLGSDWIGLFKLQYPRDELTLPELNQILARDHIFQVPLEWNERA